jgi:hypothetical protein
MGNDDGMNELVATSSKNALQSGGLSLILPAVIVDAGQRASKRFIAFFTANIRMRIPSEADHRFRRKPITQSS